MSNTLIFKLIVNYILSKKYCNYCNMITPHKIMKKSSMIVEECLYCRRKTYISFENIKKIGKKNDAKR